MTRTPSDWAKEADSIIGSASFPNYQFHTQRVAGGLLVQASFFASNNDAPDDPNMTEHRTRQWFIPTRATKDAIACTLLKLVLCSLEHEAREQLRFDGVAVFHPHKPLDFMDVGLVTPL